MRRAYRRRHMPYPELARWLAICPPVGLYYLWQKRFRLHWTLKLLISAAATGCCACMLAGVMSLFSTPVPVMAQASTAVLVQQDIYPLVVDPDGSLYHLADCVNAKPDAMPITLVQAARQGIPADETCNPPRYDNHN